MDQAARDALQRLIAAEHRLHEQMRQHERLAERWQTRAELVLRRGEDELASEALARKAEHQRRAGDLRSQYLDHGDAVRNAKRRLAAERPERVGQAASLPSLAARPAAAAKLDSLSREDRLERQLAELKRQLTARG